MQLSLAEFDQKFSEQKLRIAFVGMSNIGKSFRARELEEYRDFERYTIDDHIGKSLGIKSDEELAHWLGMPYDTQFRKNQFRYLDLEGKLTKLAKIPLDRNFVLDTTGSVIYLANEILNFLRKNYLIINFRTPKNLRKKMFEKFIENPKPLIWGNIFKQNQNESKFNALKKCYHELLEWRDRKYFELADVTMNIFQEDDSETLSADEFWRELRKNLAKIKFGRVGFNLEKATVP